MPDDGFLIVFPSYTLWSSDDGTPLVSKIDEVKVIPIFTDLDSAKTFVERRGLPCNVSTLPDKAELRKFLACFKKTDRVCFDPADTDLKYRSLYTVEQVLDAN